MQDTITANEIRIAADVRDGLVARALGRVDAERPGLPDEERVTLAASHAETLTARYLRAFQRDHGQAKTRRMLAAFEQAAEQG